MTAPATASKDARSARREPSPKLVRIIDRAACILECFSHATPELGLSQVCSRLSLPKPTVFRILTVLVRNGLLQYNPVSNVYMLGFSTLRYAENFLNGFDIRALARDAMQTIRDAINETVVLSVREGDYRYNIDGVHSIHAISQAQQIGVPIPLYAGAASRVLLAVMRDDEIRAYLARVKPVAFSKTTITAPEQLLKDVAAIRKRGYATSHGEFTPGGFAIASAIPGKDRSAAAIHISIPAARFSAEREQHWIRTLRDGIRACATSP